MKKSVLTLSLLLTLTGLAACNGTGNSSANQLFDVEPTTFDHYYSNKISFADMNIDVEGKTFIDDKIEKVVYKRDGVDKVGIKYVTDGDTAVFYTSGTQDSFTNPLGRSYSYFTCRFLSIDTPESTSSIAPWGKKASAYAKSLLENAEGIIVDATSIDTSNFENPRDSYAAGCRLDSNGTRWLGLIWYCPDGKDANDLNNYRCYQLDMIEEGYSFYTGNYNPKINGNINYVYNVDQEEEPILYSRYEETFGSMTLADIFFEADIRTSSLEQRHIGAEDDPDYDYSSEPKQMSITDAIANYDTLSKNNTYVALTGVITRFIGVNFYFEDAKGTALYVYMGLDAKSIGSLFKVGDTINIRGRMSEYGGQIQLTDIVWAQETFTKVEGEGAVAMPAPIQITSNDFTIARLEELQGKLVTVTLNIEHKGNVSKDYSYTLNCTETVKDLTAAGYQYDSMGIRINGKLSPTYSPEEGDALVGKKVTVTGIMSKYYEEDLTLDEGENFASYQLVVGNRPTTDGVNGTEIIVVE